MILRVSKYGSAPTLGKITRHNLITRTTARTAHLDEIITVNQQQAENTARKLATMEGVFAGISSGGALYAALQLSKRVENSVIVSIVCDRGDRYLSSGVFPA